MLGTFTYTGQHQSFVAAIALRWSRDSRHGRKHEPASAIQERMDAQFPILQHNAMWLKIFEACGIK